MKKIKLADGNILKVGMTLEVIDYIEGNNNYDYKKGDQFTIIEFEEAPDSSDFFIVSVNYKGEIKDEYLSYTEFKIELKCAKINWKQRLKNGN